MGLKEQINKLKDFYTDFSGGNAGSLLQDLNAIKADRTDTLGETRQNRELLDNILEDIQTNDAARATMQGDIAALRGNLEALNKRKPEVAASLAAIAKQITDNQKQIEDSEKREKENSLDARVGALIEQGLKEDKNGTISDPNKREGFGLFTNTPEGDKFKKDIKNGVNPLLASADLYASSLPGLKSSRKKLLADQDALKAQQAEIEAQKATTEKQLADLSDRNLVGLNQERFLNLAKRKKELEAKQAELEDYQRALAGREEGAQTAYDRALANKARFEKLKDYGMWGAGGFGSGALLGALLSKKNKVRNAILSGLVGTGLGLGGKYLKDKYMA